MYSKRGVGAGVGGGGKNLLSPWLYRVVLCKSQLPIFGCTWLGLAYTCSSSPHSMCKVSRRQKLAGNLKTHMKNGKDSTYDLSAQLLLLKDVQLVEKISLK